MDDDEDIYTEMHDVSAGPGNQVVADNQSDRESPNGQAMFEATGTNSGQKEATTELDRRHRTETENLSTFFRNIGAISTLDSGFTFALIVSTLQDAAQVSSAHRFDASTVIIFIAISWLLFTIALIAGIFPTLFVMKKDE
ncbi:hypothetical protein B0T14DRAFT_566393 [Immersiella caudata]|uniref:Uncharacterized protein n=1 Tax=Immersiella caudata TaxID=314043 RepID=A0AA40BZX4_9PEZI|nr:hypothetical protein B0T14DRAFT_566393 [Immersiella caudata]